jgi:hypothetical protein
LIYRFFSGQLAPASSGARRAAKSGFFFSTLCLENSTQNRFSEYFRKADRIAKHLQIHRTPQAAIALHSVPANRPDSQVVRELMSLTAPLAQSSRAMTGLPCEK